MHVVSRLSRAALSAALVCNACTPDDNTVRGRGMTVAAVPATAQARIYEAAARAAFDVTDPSLSLLLDPRELPRVAGLAASGHLAGDVVTDLRRAGIFQGVCEPAVAGARGNPKCAARSPGYLLRFSPVFAIRSDSVQVYMYARAYDTPASGASPTLRFERVYQVAAHGATWRAVREGRVPKDVRGEP